MKKKNPYEKFMKTFGDEYILQISIEEASELIKAISKFKRKDIDVSKDENELITKILDGIADMEICLEELKFMFNGFDEVEEIKQIKIEKGAERAEEFLKKVDSQKTLQNLATSQTTAKNKSEKEKCCERSL